MGGIDEMFVIFFVRYLRPTTDTYDGAPLEWVDPGMGGPSRTYESAW